MVSGGFSSGFHVGSRSICGNGRTCVIAVASRPAHPLHRLVIAHAVVELGGLLLHAELLRARARAPPVAELLEEPQRVLLVLALDVRARRLLEEAELLVPLARARQIA